MYSSFNYILRRGHRKTLKIFSVLKPLYFCKGREYCIYSKNTAVCFRAEQDTLGSIC